MNQTRWPLFRQYRLWIAVAIFVTLPLLAFMVWRCVIDTARQGTYPGLTQSAYQAGLLGDVKLAGCSIRMPADWYLYLDSYQSLSLPDGTVSFARTAPQKVGRTDAVVSFSSRPERLPPAWLHPPERIGQLKVQRVRPEFAASLKSVVVWLPDAQLYVGAGNAELMHDALRVAAVSCSGG